MALVRWDPSRELDTLQTDLDRVFDAFFGGRASNGTARRWVPAMDLIETDDHLVLKGDLPGLDKDDVEVEVKDGVLTVSGERKTEHEDSSRGYHRVERSYGRFSRSLSLPRRVTQIRCGPSSTRVCSRSASRSRRRARRIASGSDRASTERRGRSKALAP